MEWVEISKLGRAIVSQLNIDEYDTLSRWMAFRLAELIDLAAVDDSVKDAASDLILRVWRLRSDWPSGWPPATAAIQLKWLFPPNQHQVQPPAGGEERLMRTIVDELSREYRFWLKFASIHSLNVTPDEEAILAVEPTHTQDLIRRLIALVDQEEAEVDSIETHEKLESLFEARRSLLRDALESADKKTPLATESGS